jgi:hypothetical protein
MDFDSTTVTEDLASGEHNALESQTLDLVGWIFTSVRSTSLSVPNVVALLVIGVLVTMPERGGVGHAKFCTYDQSSLPTCLHPTQCYRPIPFLAFVIFRGAAVSSRTFIQFRFTSIFFDAVLHRLVAIRAKD